MRLVISAIGKMRPGPEATLVEDYLKRASDIGRHIGLSGPDLFEGDAPKGLTGAERQRREGAALVEKTPERSLIFLLDERGENISSEALASLIGRHRDDGAPAAAFLIGGADGHGPDVKNSATKKLSFGAATWPHMLVRAMLAEQLYRATTILSGRPYHRS